MRLRDYYEGMKVRCLYDTEIAGVYWGFYKDKQDRFESLSYYPTQVTRGMTGIVVKVTKIYEDEAVMVLLDDMPTVIAIWRQSQVFEEAIDACED